MIDTLLFLQALAYAATPTVMKSDHFTPLNEGFDIPLVSRRRPTAVCGESLLVHMCKYQGVELLYGNIRTLQYYFFSKQFKSKFKIDLIYFHQKLVKVPMLRNEELN